VHPTLAPVIAEAIEETNCGIRKMRCPYEDFSVYPWFKDIPNKQFYETISQQALETRHFYEAKGICFPDVVFLFSFRVYSC